MKSNSTQLLGYVMFLVAFLTGALLLVWFYMISVKPIQTAPFYHSQIGSYLLNHSIALAIQPTGAQDPMGQFDVQTVVGALQRQSNCLERLHAQMQPSWMHRQLIAWNIFGQRCDTDCQMQHLSGRLQIINQAVLQASTVQQRQGYLSQRYYFDLQRWAAQTCNALGHSVRIESARKTSQVQIVPEHMLSSMKQFAQAAPYLFERGNVYWCERYRNVISTTATQSQYCQVSSRHVEFSSRALAVSNPWSGLQGCLYLQGENQPYFVASTRGNPRQNQAYRAWCAQSLLASANREAKVILTALQPPSNSDLTESIWGLPKDFDWIMQSSMPLRKARELWSSAPDDPTSMVNLLEHHTVNLLGYEQPVGLHVASTIQVERQAKLQQLAQCFVGDQALCKQLGLPKRYSQLEQEFGTFAEQAPVRSVGIVQLDVASGEIEALASGHSTCFAHDHQFAKSTKGCPKVNYVLRTNPELLRNHAYFDEAQPASTNKPIIALSLMQSPPSNLAFELARSNSDAFAQHMFCDGVQPCSHPQNVQSLATSMGWNQSCTGAEATIESIVGDPRQDDFICGQIDPVWGRRTPPALSEENKSLLNVQSRLYGRLGVQPVAAQAWQPAGFQLTQDFTYNVQPSSRSKQYYHWIKSTQHLASDLALGQANARVSPIGVAGLYAHLVRAAQGETEQTLPHLIRGIYDQNGKVLDPLTALKPDRLQITLNAQHAAQVLHMMSGSSRRFAAGAGTAYASCIKVLAASQCNNLTDIVAGKTGTPSVATTRPRKWYVAAYRSHQSRAGFDKVIAVLVEPNWKANKLDDPNSIENAENYAADIGFWGMSLLGVFNNQSVQK